VASGKVCVLYQLRTVDAHDALVPKTIATTSELPASARTYAKRSKRPDRALTKPIAKHFSTAPDLARVLNAWPTLPEHIRRAVLALVGTAC
jgi:hypothetical protein